MIWALLEITLPLCLTFLFGLVAGWLLWRWRRRSISQAEWNSHTEGKQAADSASETLQQTANELQQKSEEQEATIAQQNTELQASDKRVQQLTSELQAANGKLATQQAATVDTDLQLLQTDFSQSADKTAELEEKLQAANARADQQTKLANELQQKLKQSETVASERDTAIAKIKELEEKVTAASQHTTELAHTKSQLEAADQKFKNFQSSVVANRQTVDAEKAKQQARIAELESTLNEERKRSEQGDADKEKMLQLETQLVQANHAANELNQAKATIANLNNQLNASRMELANKSNSQSTDNQQNNELAQQNEALQKQLEQTKQENNALQDAQSKLTAMSAQLTAVQARNQQLNNQIENKDASAVTPISVAQIKKLKADIEEKDALIKKLQQKGKKKPAQKGTKQTQTKTRKSKDAWKKGETKIGTPGSDHKDDLTAINGIGPKIEKVLNRMGIKSWEQLATLKAAEINKVDEKLADFSGRIQRDEWVPQAKAIMRNGHAPLNGKKPKKSNKKPGKSGSAKAAKKAWHKGKTKFGTPGSAHRDDLKVINGIGPVLEKALNRRGIRSWEQLAALKVKEAKLIDEALAFPGRIAREQWIQQAKALVKQFPDHADRPTRRTFLNQAAAR